jgi:phosphoglycolate phosphatase
MSTRPRLICFDWDGTLINASDNITYSIIETGVSFGYKRLHPKLIESKIGLPFGQVINALFPNININAFERLYLETYQERPISALLPHALEVIHHLKHAFILSIVTNKQKVLVEKELQHYKLEQSFDSVFSAQDYAAKPSPIMLREAAMSHHVSLSETWLVGDSLSDFYAAQSASINKVILLKPKHIPRWGDNLISIQTLDELCQLLSVPVYE